MSRLSLNPDLAPIWRGDHALRIGGRGGSVRAVQQALLRLGFDVGDAGADGVFGRDTRVAVMRFQQANGLTSSGEVDRETLGFLDSALEAKPESQPPTKGPDLPEEYILQPITDLRVLDARTELTARDRDIRTVHPEGVGADIITSGTFHSGRDPAGPLIQGGSWLTSGGWPHGRGGVAVLADGTVRIGFYPEPNQLAVRNLFESLGNPIREFMGGGALIIEAGTAVSSADLEQRQRFVGGALAPQFEATARHTIIGVHASGKAYLIIDASPKSLEGVQEDLLMAGFRDVIMFDGGNAFGYQDAEQTLFGRVPNPLPSRLTDKRIAKLRGPRDVALTGFAIRTG